MSDSPAATASTLDANANANSTSASTAPGKRLNELKAKFEANASSASTTSPVKNESTEHKKHDLCVSCGSAVYVLTRLRVEDQTWHKGCFKCVRCHVILNLSRYHFHEHQPYCKAHYDEIFNKPSGHYSTKSIDWSSSLHHVAEIQQQIAAENASASVSSSSSATSSTTSSTSATSTISTSATTSNNHAKPLPPSKLKQSSSSSLSTSSSSDTVSLEKFQGLEKEYSLLSDIHLQLENKFSRKESMLKLSDERLEEAQKTISDLENANTELRTRLTLLVIQAANSGLADSRTQLAEKEKTAEEIISSMQQEISRLEQEVSRLRTDNKKLSDLNKTLSDGAPNIPASQTPASPPTSVRVVRFVAPSLAPAATPLLLMNNSRVSSPVASPVASPRAVVAEPPAINVASNSVSSISPSSQPVSSPESSPSDAVNVSVSSSSPSSSNSEPVSHSSFDSPAPLSSESNESSAINTSSSDASSTSTSITPSSSTVTPTDATASFMKRESSQSLVNFSKGPTRIVFTAADNASTPVVSFSATSTSSATASNDDYEDDEEEVASNPLALSLVSSSQHSASASNAAIHHRASVMPVSASTTSQPHHHGHTHSFGLADSVGHLMDDGAGSDDEQDASSSVSTTATSSSSSNVTFPSGSSTSDDRKHRSASFLAPEEEDVHMTAEQKVAMQMTKALQKQAQELPVLSSWLEKKSPSLLRAWQSRYVLISDYNLYYAPFKITLNADGSAPPQVNCVPLLVCKSIEKNKNKDPNQFIVEARDSKTGQLRSYEFRTDSSKECERWVEGLNLHRDNLMSMLRWASLSGNNNTMQINVQ